MEIHEGNSRSTSLQTTRPSSDQACRVELIREWLFKFVLNSGVTVSPEQASGLVAVWLEGFADVALRELEAAFTACLRSHQFKTIPTVADVRRHLTRAGENELVERATRRCEIVFSYAANLSPDYPDRNPPQFSEREKAGVRAAGGLAHIRDCDLKSLEFARRNFIAGYVRFSELESQQALLPDGKFKAMLAQVAAGMSLPALTAGAQ